MDDVQNRNLKKVHAKKNKYYFHKKKVATVVADESESPSVIPGVEEEVAIVGESSSVLAPSIFPEENSLLMELAVFLLMCM